MESRELHPQRGILEGNRLVAVQQESNEANKHNKRSGMVRRLSASIAFKVKVLSADEIMAMHNWPPWPCP